MTNRYPQSIPAPTPLDRDRKIIVQDDQEHLAANPAHYARVQQEIELERKQLGAVLAKTPAEERERCAQVAEQFEGGGDIGIGIAAAIRATGIQLSLYPKLLRSDACQLVGDDKFSVANPNGTFSRPDVTVNNPDEEAAARADGYLTEVAPPPSAAMEPEALALFPKTLRDPATSNVTTSKFTEHRGDGQYVRPDVVVNDPVQEQAARADGFTVEIPNAPANPLTV